MLKASHAIVPCCNASVFVSSAVHRLLSCHCVIKLIIASLVSGTRYGCNCMTDKIQGRKNITRGIILYSMYMIIGYGTVDKASPTSRTKKNVPVMYSYSYGRKTYRRRYCTQNHHVISTATCDIVYRTLWLLYLSGKSACRWFRRVR